MSDCILAETDSRGIATLILNRPEKANSYSYAMLDSLASHFERLGSDEKVRAIVLRGAGRHFSAGADMAGAEPATPGSRGIYQICCLIDETPRPTVALVQGDCVGGGMALAACCDIVLAERKAFFSIPEVRFGFTPGPLSLVFARAIGMRQFRRYAQTGQRFSAEEAHRMGFVHQLCDPDALEKALHEQLEEVLLAAPNAARSAKTIALRLGSPAGEGFAAQLQAEFMQSRTSTEAEEGTASFREKRRPGWYRGE